MEVHHHSHHHEPDGPDTHNHGNKRGRRKWTHYFWEFIMLFFAVTLGFLVENQREHYVEHQRATVYAINLYEELKKDTSQLNAMITNLRFTSQKLDTFCRYVKGKEKQAPSNGMLYYYSSYVTTVEYFSSNNTTVEQLKGSGNLRIMGNALAYKISEYDKKLRDLDKEYSLSKSEFSKMEDLHFRIFDMYTSEIMLAGPRTKPRDSVFALTELPINRDPELMQQYTGWLKFESNIYIFQMVRYLTPLKELATDLLAILKKEYHLK